MRTFDRALALALLLAPCGVVLAQSDPFVSAPPPRSRPGPATAPTLARPPLSPPSGVLYPVPVGQAFRDCTDCPELMVIPAGRFIMGSPAGEQTFGDYPQHEVAVRSPLAVGKYEVTFSEWDVCVAANGCAQRPSDEGWGRGRRPVIRVTWRDAQQYVTWLSNLTGQRYRLLTEAEWEYAARAGTTEAYAFGASIAPQQANFGLNIGRTQEVGSYPANRFGLHDMHGNVLEWVEDVYRDSYVGAPRDASLAVSSGRTSRVLRGGSWLSPLGDLRSARRHWQEPGQQFHTDGFRVARMPGS